MGDELTSDQVIGGIGTALSGLFSVASSYQAGDLEEILYDHNAAMTTIEAQLVSYNTEQQVKRLDESEDRELAASRAAAVGEGFALSSGTNIALEGDILRANAIDRSVIRATGGLEETGLLLEAEESELKGDIAKSGSTTESVQTLLGTTSKLLELKG